MSDIRTRANLECFIHGLNQYEIVALVESLLGSLKAINRMASPGHRTMDDMLRDLDFICATARAALAKGRQEEFMTAQAGEAEGRNGEAGSVHEHAVAEGEAP